MLLYITLFEVVGLYVYSKFLRFMLPIKSKRQRLKLEMLTFKNWFEIPCVLKVTPLKDGKELHAAFLLSQINFILMTQIFFCFRHSISVIEWSHIRTNCIFKATIFAARNHFIWWDVFDFVRKSRNQIPCFRWCTEQCKKYIRHCIGYEALSTTSAQIQSTAAKYTMRSKHIQRPNDTAWFWCQHHLP